MYYWSSYTINKGWIRNDANWEYHNFTHKGKQLTYEERCQIEALKAQERPLSNRKIVKQLGRAPQPIHIEVKNGTVRLIWLQKKMACVTNMKRSSIPPRLVKLPMKKRVRIALSNLNGALHLILWPTPTNRWKEKNHPLMPW